MSKQKQSKLKKKITNLLVGLTHKDAYDLLQQVKDELYDKQKVIKV